MADNDSVFNVNEEDLSFALDQDEQNDDTNQESDAILQTLVGEGKKFKSINDLARSVIHKDLHIKKIEEENRTLRQATAETKTVDQLLKALNASNSSGTTVTDRSLESNQNVDVNNAPVASVEEVSKKVLEALEAKTAAQTQQNNLNQVKQALIRQFGADYANVLKAKADELGMDTDTVDMMARKTPKALFSLLGVQSTTSLSPSPNQSSRTEAVAGKPNEKTFSYYEKLRKSNPKLYESKQIQNEIMQEAMRQGQNFYR
jgi:hypothetical protein